MPKLSMLQMRSLLGRSIASLSENRLNHVLAQIHFRNYLKQIGLTDRISAGGFLAKRNILANSTVVLFPETVEPGKPYPATRPLPEPSHSLHTICATFHQSGIAGYYCAARVGQDDDYSTLSWHAAQLGLPTQQSYQPLLEALAPLNFTVRSRNYNFLRYQTDASMFPDGAVAEEFSKENLRVQFSTHYLAEISDIDGIFWGQQHTYPIEIKEKTPGSSTDMGPFFGLDVGPFVKLAFYVAKRGNLHSLYVVREINNTQDRNLVQWWFITFDHLAQFASWVPQAGGPSMGGGRSSVVRVPRSEFRPLIAAALNAL
jgi:hypothetical protein